MIRRLNLINFRSYRTIELLIEKPLVVILGPNAVGKTNLLESIYVVTTTRSFRAKDRDMIHYGENFYRIVAGFESGNQEVRFETEGTSYRKSVLIDKSRRPQTALAGLNPVTIFEPNDMNLLLGSPEARRKYLDVILSQISPAYSRALSSFRKILKQRNSLIHRAKQGAGVSGLDDQLFVWDLQMVDPASVIIEARRDFLDCLNPLLTSYYEKISGRRDEIVLKYLPGVLADRDSYLSIIKSSFKRDIQAGYTTKGPHRDDFVAYFKEHELGKVASRGELRTIMLALKLSEMDYIELKLKKRPILLLDDVFSELDASRREFLVDNITSQQTIITTTDIDETLHHDYQLIDLSGAGYVA